MRTLPARPSLYGNPDRFRVFSDGNTDRTEGALVFYLRHDS